MQVSLIKGKGKKEKKFIQKHLKRILGWVDMNRWEYIYLYFKKRKEKKNKGPKNSPFACEVICWQIDLQQVKKYRNGVGTMGTKFSIITVNLMHYFNFWIPFYCFENILNILWKGVCWSITSFEDLWRKLSRGK